jgi:hypothetical protein
MKAYYAALAGQQSGYAMAAARVRAKYKATLSSLPSDAFTGAPACVGHTDHDAAAKACYVLSSGIKGLGAFSWSTLPQCFVADMPVCGTPPTMPLAPVDPPMPKALRAKPVAPKQCVSAPATTTTTATMSVPVPQVRLSAPIPGPLPAEEPLPIVEASMTETKSSAGLLVVIVLAAGAGAYLLLRKKKA